MPGSARALALGGVCALAFGVVAAQAQTAAGPTTVEEVTVTAQKRAEEVQDVPISVTPLTGAAIERLHVQDLKDVTGSIPNVQINVNSGVANAAGIAIRGIGVVNNPSPFAGTEVAVVVDGVVQGTNQSGLTDQFDVERIEVLRGPQGTLFGANTTGGVVNIIMRQPTGEFGAYGTVTAGNYNRMDVSAAVNFPIVEGVLAGKVSVSHRGRDGFYTNLYNGDDIDKVNSTKLRGYLKWTPSDDLDMTLASEFQRVRNGDILLQNLSYPGQIFYRPGTRTDFKIYVDVPNNNRFDAQSHTLTTNWSSALGQVTAITNYSRYSSESAIDFDGIDCFCMASFGKSRGWQASQEIRDVIHPTDNIEVLIGGFAHVWSDSSDGMLVLPFASPTSFSRGLTKVRSTNLSAFSQVYWSLTDRLRVQGGVRVSWEKVRLARANYNYLRPAGTDPMLGRGNLQGAILQPLPVGNEPNEGEETWANIGGKVGFDYKFADGLMVYGYYARGFKSGGFNGRVTSKENIGPFDPEFVDSFEIGFKSDFLDRRARLNVSAFLNKWKDMQVAQSIFREDGALASLILNAGEATTKGVEAEAELVPFQGLRLNATVGYLDAVYDQFASGNGPLCPRPPAAQPAACATDYSERDLPFAPKWNASVGGTYTFDVAGGEAAATVQYTYTSKKWGNYTQTVNERLEAVGLVNANVSWGPRDAKWSIVVWGRNLANKHYIAASLDAPPLFTEAVLGNPRQVGVDFKFNF